MWGSRGHYSPMAAVLSQAATTNQWHQAAASSSFKIHSDKKKQKYYNDQNKI